MVFVSRLEEIVRNLCIFFLRDVGIFLHTVFLVALALRSFIAIKNPFLCRNLNKSDFLGVFDHMPSEIAKFIGNVQFLRDI